MDVSRDDGGLFSNWKLDWVINLQRYPSGMAE